MLTRTIAPLLALLLTACSSAPTPAAPDASPPAPPAPPVPGDATPPSGGARPSLSAEECQKQGGTVVGDIGDGATHRPDYVCASGKPPLGNVAPPPGGPIAIEGSVCCPK